MPQDFESKLVPILREGIEIVKMISFKTLRARVAATHAGRDAAFHGRLTAATINEIFGAASQANDSAGREGIDGDLLAGELAGLAAMEDMRILLTDALRMQALCDYQEGLDSSATLERAGKLGLLLSERDLPLPNTFLQLVRRLGVAHGLLHPMEQAPADPLNP